MKKFSFFLLISGIFLFFSIPGPYLYAQESDELEEEAPEYLLDMNLGDMGADVFWEGYWRYTVSYGTGWEYGEEGFVFPSAFSGMQYGLEFSQTPDFFLSVLLLDHYFLETSFSEGYDKNTYVMGYMGDEESTVQEVRIGNAGIGIGDYEGIDVSSPDYNTPGISGRFKTQKSEHEFMVRYDPTDEQSKSYIGSYEVTEEEIALTSYEEGRYFILPNTDISSLTLYMEEDGGELTGSDGRSYTKLNLEYSVDLTGGFLTLDSAADGRVLVYYEVGGTPVGDPAIAEDFIIDGDANYRPDPDQPLLAFDRDLVNPYDPDGGTFETTSFLTLDGNDALLIHSPGEFSSFQLYNRYAYSSSLPDESWRTSITLEDSGADPDDNTDFSYLTDSDERMIKVQLDDSDSRDPENRVPFYGSNPEIYGPAPVTDSAKISRELVIAVKEDTDGYSLGTGVVKGSVTVYVNDIEDQTVDVDYDTGKLSFSRYIFSDDRITVTYRTESSGFSGGDLFMAQGNRLNLAEGMSLELAESLRWTIPEDQLTEESDESPGIIDLAANWFYEKENLNLKVSTGMTLRSPDTAGNLRILGMEESGYSFSVSEDQLLPAEEDLTPVSSYNAADRVDLIYRDFFSTSTTGQTYLNSYNWSGASVDSSEEGPSVAAAASNDDDYFSSRVMVMTYDIAGTEWSAGDYLPVEEEMIDLSGYSELSFYLRRQNLVSDDLALTLYLGENGESEDLDDNGTVDSGDSSYLISRSITLPASEDSWEKVTLSLTASERKKLTRVRSFRFILENAASGVSEGELLAAGFRGEGSPLLLKVFNSSGVEQDNNDISGTEIDDSSLEASFSEVDDTFHPDGDSQKVLKITWGTDAGGSDLDLTDYWTGTSYMDGLTAGDYGEFSLYIKHGQTGGTAQISLTDPDDRGVTLLYTPGGTSWEKLTVNLREGTAEFSGSSSVDSLNIDEDASAFTRFKIGMTALDPGTQSGTLYVDEVHFSDPVLSTALMAEYEVDYKKSGDIYLSSGGFPILGNFDVYNRLYYYTEDRDSVFSDRSRLVQTQLNSGVDLMNVRLEGDLEMSYSGEDPSYAAGHLLRIPAQSSVFWFSDSYSRSFYAAEDDMMSRENVLYLSPLTPLSLQLESGAAGSDDELVQNWGGWISGSFKNTAKVKLSLNLYQTSDWTTESVSYFNDWAEDFQYLKPLEEDIDYRQGRGSSRLDLTGEVMGFTWKTNQSYTAEDSYEWTQDNLWKSDISFPLTLKTGRGSWTIEPGYSRTLENTLYPDEYGGFRDDWDSWYRGINSQFPLYRFIPLYEIFTEETMNPFEESLTLTDESSYTPEVYLTVNRMPGSRLSDLIIPSGADISLNREYVSDSDTLYNESNWSFELIQSAQNLFGEYGNRSLFDFYETDEITSALQYNLSSRNDLVPEPEELVYQNYISLKKGDGWKIALDNRYSVDFQDDLQQEDLQLIFSWQEEQRSWVKVPLTERLIVKPNHMEHQETLSFSGYFDGEDSDNTYYSSTLTHESKLIIDDLGSLKGWMSIGLAGYNEVFQNGYELGLELEITF